MSPNSKVKNEESDINQQGNKIYYIKPEDISSLRRLAHSKYQAGSSLHLAESTVNAVQSALNRRATHVSQYIHSYFSISFEVYPIVVSFIEIKFDSCL